MNNYAWLFNSNLVPNFDSSRIGITGFEDSLAKMPDGIGVGLNPDNVFPLIKLDSSPSKWAIKAEENGVGFSSIKVAGPKFLPPEAGVVTQFSSRLEFPGKRVFVSENLTLYDLEGNPLQSAAPIGNVVWKLVSGFQSKEKALVKLTQVGYDEEQKAFICVLTIEHGVVATSYVNVPKVKIISAPTELILPQTEQETYVLAMA